MPRNVVVCSDGTGFSFAKNRGTNVFRLYESVAHRTPGGDEQLAIYSEGVGTQGFRPLRAIGGAFGYGLARNVVRLYAELSRMVDDENDHVFLFGFSRGAYTVRTLAGRSTRSAFCAAASRSSSCTRTSRARPTS